MNMHFKIFNFIMSFREHDLVVSIYDGQKPFSNYLSAETVATGNILDLSLISGSANWRWTQVEYDQTFRMMDIIESIQ